MDLSKLSEADLQAVAAGNMDAVSDAGLQILAGGPAPKTQYGPGRAAAQGATFGFADEIEAAARAATGQGSYPDILRDVGLSKRLYEQRAPGEALAAELGGAAGVSLIPGAGAFNLMRAPAVASRIGPAAARYGGAAVGGATAGAITGAGTAEPGQRTEGAMRGGVTGAVLGPLATGALQATGRVAQGARDITTGIPVVQQLVAPLAGAAGATTDFTRRAQEKMLQAVRRDQLTPEQIMTARQVLGDKPETLIERAGANTAGLADVAAKYPGEAKRMASQLAEERMAGQGERITADLAQAFRVQGDPEQVAEALSRKRAQDAAPLYQRAYQEGAVIDDPRVSEFMKLPAFQRAYGVARRLATYDGVELPKDPRKLQQFDLRTLDYVKRGLDDVLYQAKMPGPGGTGRTERAKISEAQQAFLATLDDIVPTYGQARAAWAGPTVLREALEAGQGAFRMDPRAMQAATSRMSPAEFEQFKIGALAALRDRVAKAGDGRDLVREVYGSPQKREMLAQLVGDQFQDLEQRFLREKAIRRTDDLIRGNSRTAERQAGMADLEGETSVLRSILNQGPVRGTVDYMLRSGSGVAQPTADALAPMLFSTNPAAQQKTLQQLIELDKLMKQRGAGIGSGVGTGAGTAGGLLQN